MIINAFLFSFFVLAVIYTFKYRFIQIYFWKESKEILKKNKSSYYVFLMTLASHLGVGNIVGVTTALIYGGPGSLVWMIISSIFLGIFSLIENTLGVKYREVINGEYRGGACYYILKGLKKPKLALVFCCLLLFANTIFFGPLQVNTLSQSIIIPFNINKFIILLFLIIFAFLVIFRGTKKIIRFIEHLVPIMTIIFFIVSIFTIIYNYDRIPGVIFLIFRDAFTFKSLGGALLGGSMIIGLKRSAFSNEAGLGTAPTLSAMSDVKSPVSQAYVQVLGVFVDTTLMCTLMGFMILVYDIELSLFAGSSLAIYIFEVILGGFGLYLGSFLLFSFALATWVSSYYIGETNMLFLSNNVKVKKVHLRNIYRVLFLISTISGVLVSSLMVWDFIDYGMVILGSINFYVMFKLEREFKQEFQKFKIYKAENALK